jgi:hypothetical protein
MHRLTFYPLGNADTCLIELDSKSVILVDFADTRNPDDEDDKRIDLSKAIRERLDELDRKDVDVLALTHLDQDHIQGTTEFFYLEHATKYQGGERVKIKDLWVPAAAITESKTDLGEEGRIVQAEARYRLQEGSGIRAFSRPDALKDWLEEHDLTVESRKHPITDAGRLVPGFVKHRDGIELFAHSPFADKEEGRVVDRNSRAIVFQATFDAGVRDTQVLFNSDAPHEILERIVKVTLAHGNDDRLKWDMFKVPHHCSYLSLGPDKAKEETTPVKEVAWLVEDQGRTGGIAISSSDPIPTEDTDQPPHRQAAAYYKRVCRKLGGQFHVTMQHESASSPTPLVIKINHLGATVEKRSTSTAARAIGRPAPRAGHV